MEVLVLKNQTRLKKFNKFDTNLVQSPRRVKLVHRINSGITSLFFNGFLPTVPHFKAKGHSFPIKPSDRNKIIKHLVYLDF